MVSILTGVKANVLQAALDYLDQGLAVFPLTPREKIPNGYLVPQGVKEASKDRVQIQRWWHAAPASNIGVAGGEASGVFFVDLDDGAIEADLEFFPRTVTVKTRDGYHLYFKLPPGGIKNGPLALPPVRKDGSATAAKANVRATNQYVVGVTSVVADWEYAWHRDLGGVELSPSVGFANAPEWLLQGTEIAPAKRRGGARPGAGRPQGAKFGAGEKHRQLVKIRASMHARGCTLEQIEKELNQVDNDPTQFDHPKGPEEIKRLVYNWDPKIEINPDIADAYILALGHDETEYFYTTSSNRQIVRLSRSGHNSTSLLDLMPLEYWNAKYPGGKSGVTNWMQAASDLMHECREVGIFSARKVRGLGCWREGTELVIHLGNRIYRRQKYEPLAGVESKWIYALGSELPDIAPPMALSECQILIDAVNCLNWRDPQNAFLFAGGLAILRLCGALPWRPMLWLTGPTGSGKSTVLDYVVRNIVGEFGILVQGASTEAGLRQEIGCDAMPVVFDEAEANNQRTSNRMQAILELIRQSSSDGDGRIVKGTADGRGHNFKVNCAFLLSSIRVCLEEEADLNRFTVLELLRNDPAQWETVSTKLSRVTPQYGDSLFSRMVHCFPLLLANQAVLSEMIAAKSDMRTGQQLGILLAAYWCLKSDSVIDQASAQQLVRTLTLACAEDRAQEHDEQECLDWLLDSKLTFKDLNGTHVDPVRSLIVRAVAGSTELQILRESGIDLQHEHAVLVRNKHPELIRIFSNTKWGKNWSRSLRRLSGADEIRIRAEGEKHQKRYTSIPWAFV